MSSARDYPGPVPARDGDVRSAEALERDVEQIRSRIDHTLTQIEDRLSLNRLIDRALEHLHGERGLFAANRLGWTVRRHPVPTAMFAAGLASLLCARQGDKSGRRRRPLAPGTDSDRLREASPPPLHFAG